MEPEKLKLTVEEIEKRMSDMAQQVKELHSEFSSIGIALKGSKSMNITGIFDRLVESERHTVEFRKYCETKLESIEKSMDQKIQLVEKDIQLMNKELDIRFREVEKKQDKHEHFIELMGSKLLRRLIWILVSLGVIIIGVMKDWGGTIISFLNHLKDL